MIPLLIATRHPFPGGQQVKCHCCPNQVVDDPRNIARVEREKGYIICDECAITIKAMYPALNVEAQMWEGHLREPQPCLEWKPLLDFLNKKS